MAQPNIVTPHLQARTELVLKELNDLGRCYADDGLTLRLDRDYDLEFPGKPEFRASVTLHQVIRLPYDDGTAQ